jgi:prephenate dehydrogenase
MIGGSLGLALRESEVASTIVGHDMDRAVNQEAKKLGVVDRTDWNLVSACEEADLVILAIPLGGIADTMEAIGPHLRSGCVVMDTTAIKRPVMDWASQFLPEYVHFVGGNPILSGTAGVQGGLQAARADLFHSGLFCLVPSPTVDSEAVKLATDLVSILGAKPLFLDLAEHDGLMAAVDQLPTILALALAETMIRQPTWRELRKVAGPAFETGTQLVGVDPFDTSDVYAANRDNILRWIDNFSAVLGSIRQTLAEEDAEAMVTPLQGAIEERQKWLADRTEGQWHEGPKTELPSRQNLLDSFFGTFWRRGPKREE